MLYQLSYLGAETAEGAGFAVPPGLSDSRDARAVSPASGPCLPLRRRHMPLLKDHAGIGPSLRPLRLILYRRL